MAVLLTVMQASPPVPRQTADANTGKRQPVKHDARANQKPTTQSSPSVQTVSPDPDQNTNSEQRSSDASKPIRIGEIPPVSVSRDWIDGATLLFSAALLIVGVCGVRAAYRTLKAIEGQVEVQKESLRARITIGFQGNVFAEMLHDGRAVVCAKLINTGGTPAYKVIPETWIEFVSPRFEDFTGRAIHHTAGPLAVYPTTPTLFDIPLGRRADYNDIAGLRQAQTTLAVRIKLTYESLGKQYLVDRAFFATPDGMQLHPKYNEAN